MEEEMKGKIVLSIIISLFLVSHIFAIMPLPLAILSEFHGVGTQLQILQHHRMFG